MAEANNIEAEIAELSREIEAKKRELEASKGIVEEREALHEVVADHLGVETKAPSGGVPDATPPSALSQTATSPVSTKPSKQSDYLAGLDEETTNEVNTLIASIPTTGLKKVINQARNFSPLVLDAFHDAVVDKLYTELKERGIIK